MTGKNGEDLPAKLFFQLTKETQSSAAWAPLLEDLLWELMKEARSLRRRILLLEAVALAALVLGAAGCFLR